MGLVNAFEYKGGVNGLKVLLGVAAISLAAQVGAFEQAVATYPDSASIVDPLRVSLSKVLSITEGGLQVVGYPLTIWGVFDKIKKIFKK